MAKPKTIGHYQKQISERCVRMYDEQFAEENEELIWTAARNKRLLERFDNELDDQSLTVMSTGSQGQAKEDINPIIKHRNDIAKLYADNLDALMLTPRARYKKQEGGQQNKGDKMADFFNSLNK